MDKIKVKSKYTEAEIEKNFKDVDFFDGIMSGLEDALAYKNGLSKAATIVRKRSLPVIDVVGVRRDLNMTQRDFAWVLGVSVRTVESWEIGRSVPSPTAKKLMFLISQDHSLVEKLQQSA